jgi:hypothetical protein
MNTMMISKTISPRMSSMSGPVESWAYGLLNACIIGGSTSVSAWLGMTAAKSIGVDVPTLNFKAVAVIFISGAAVKFFAYLSQGLPQLQKNDAEEQAAQPK